MIKHVFFDIDDTLFPSTEFSKLARRNAINAMIRMGLKQTYEQLSCELDNIIKRRGSNYSNHFDELCKRFNVSQPAKYVAAAIVAYHDTKTSIAPYPQVPPMLMKLKESGYHLHIATNGNSVKQWDKLIRLKIAFYFEGVFVSQELGREKDPQFFKLILKELKTKPVECIMIGDREDADIIPARKIGIKTIRILTGKQKRVPTKADYKLTNPKKFATVTKILLKQ